MGEAVGSPGIDDGDVDAELRERCGAGCGRRSRRRTRPSSPTGVPHAEREPAFLGGCEAGAGVFESCFLHAASLSTALAARAAALLQHGHRCMNWLDVYSHRHDRLAGGRPGRDGTRWGGASGTGTSRWSRAARSAIRCSAPRTAARSSDGRVAPGGKARQTGAVEHIRAVVLVEGASDKVALETLAVRRGPRSRGRERVRRRDRRRPGDRPVRRHIRAAGVERRVGRFLRRGGGGCVPSCPGARRLRRRPRPSRDGAARLLHLRP